MKESFRQINFPQFHPDKQGKLHPRASAILGTLTDSLHYLLCFGKCSESFRKFVKRSAIEGTNIHNAIRQEIPTLINQHMITRGSAVNIQPNLVTHTLNQNEQLKVNRFLQWAQATKPEILAEPEKTIVSPELGYGGSPDLILRMHGKNYIVDIKSGRNIHEPHLLQVSSYAELAQKKLDIQIDHIAILILNADTASGVDLVIKNITDERRSAFQRLLEKWYELFPEPFPLPIREKQTDVPHSLLAHAS